jgi:hypothetical protein
VKGGGRANKEKKRDRQRLGRREGRGAEWRRSRGARQAVSEQWMTTGEGGEEEEEEEER